ncbi:amino acid transporter [Raphidocelis subcapitata]|uniref:Amino acid transporter n=1 Tax=Raphidocelis subcapitata TaxID=307507 RepID=A0A2V0NZA8_9CHLO|nr:amino acid transporter [Raphidocelis subcapitata]|eukprot:GBF92964.1 amino acid transporter [Raphidocelis subcapitata]
MAGRPLREPLLAAAAADAAPDRLPSRRSSCGAPGGSSGAVSVVVEEEGEDARSGCSGGGGVPQQGDTFNICAFNLSKVILGAGLMAMPKAMFLLGVVPGTFLMVAIGLLTHYTLATGLIASSDRLGAKSYAALVSRTLGVRAEGLLQLSVFVTCWVMEVVFLVVIADILVGHPPDFHGLISELTGATGRAASSRPLVLGVLCAFVLLPLGSMRSMEHLATVNIIGVASNAVFALLMLVLLAAACARGLAVPPPLMPRWGELSREAGGGVGAALVLASTAPIILSCFTCHQSLHPLLPSLRPYTTRRAQGVVATSLAIAGVLYYVISLCACAVFGPSLHDDILTDATAARMAPILGSEAAARGAALVVRAGYLLSLTGSFLLLLFPLRHVLGEVLLGGHEELAASSNRRWLGATAALTGTAYATACFLPGIWGALSLVGATAATAQAWIIPSLIILALDSKRLLSSGGGGGGGAEAGPAAAAGAGSGAAGWARARRRGAAGVILVVGVFMFAQAFVGAFL